MLLMPSFADYFYTLFVFLLDEFMRSLRMDHKINCKQILFEQHKLLVEKCNGCAL